jgi:hypothetical protein
VVPLSEAAESDELLGGAAPRRTLSDAVANRVLVHGDPMAAPAGRSDDFAWPPRGVAPVGTDPVVATTTLPMTPMQSEQPAAAAAPAQEAAVGPAQAKPRLARPRVAQQQSSQGRPDPRRYAPPPPQQPAFYFPFFRHW